MINHFLQINITPEDTVVVNKIQENARETIEHIATTPLNELLPELIKEIINFGIKVLVALIIYAVGAWLIKKIRNMVHRIFERKKTDKAISSFIESLTSISLTIILVIITVGALGVNTTSLAALLAAGGMAIGMALSGTVQNFAGGIMILVFKPFKAGDFIETENGYSGTVTDVNIFSTKLTTVDNKLIIIPNGSLSNGTINNYSGNKMRRVEWKIGVEYGTDSVKVKKALKDIVDTEKKVLYVQTGAPADPLIALNALQDSAVEYVVRVWVKTEDYWDVFYRLNERIYTLLPTNGIGFPFPQMDIHMFKGDSSDTDTGTAAKE